MPVVHSELAILSAEQFVDGVVSSRRTARRVAAPSSSGEDAPSSRAKKRTKKQDGSATAAAPNDGDEKKRARGRPRLNANDESAAERRRTQIRLAQRAYRNRKENTITTLEQQVKRLRDTNEEMSNAFMALHDFAVHHGLLDDRPDFGARLRSTTERFVALARKSAETEEDGASKTQRDEAHGGDDPKINTPTSPSSPEDAVERSPVPVSTADGASQPQQLYGGLIVTHEYVPVEASMDVSMASGYPGLHDFGDQAVRGGGDPSWAELETVTQPTFENASFPFTDEQLRSLFGPGAPSPSPYPPAAAPPPPRSYAASESTFGRRLNRFANERALALISLDNPPPLVLVRVFGFCLPFESADQIKQRLSATLHRRDGESLYYWQFPFHHLGGGGTHFGLGAVSSSPRHFGNDANAGSDSQQQQQQRRLGNQGKADVLRPLHGAGYAMGPLTRRVSESCDSRLDARQRIAVPGFEGDFYDPDEVELWLRRRGIDIAPGQDFVTLEVDLSLFESDDADAQQQQQQYPAAGAGTLPNPDFMGYSSLGHGGGANSSGDAGVAPEYHSDMASSIPPTTAAATATANPTVFLPPSPLSSSQGEGVEGMWSNSGNTNESGLGDMSGFMFPGVSYGSPGSFPTTTGGDFQDGSMMAFSTDMSMPQHQPAQQRQLPRKTMVTLDVNMLVEKLTAKGTCMGRYPGFRLKNIRQAFLESAHRL